MTAFIRVCGCCFLNVVVVCFECCCCCCFVVAIFADKYGNSMYLGIILFNNRYFAALKLFSKTNC